MNQIYALINTLKTNKRGYDNIVLFLLILILVLVRWRTARLSFPFDEFLETSFIYSMKIWRVHGFLHFFSLWGTYNHTHLFPKGNSIILQRGNLHKPFFPISNIIPPVHCMHMIVVKSEDNKQMKILGKLMVQCCNYFYAHLVKQVWFLRNSRMSLGKDCLCASP